MSFSSDFLLLNECFLYYILDMCNFCFFQTTEDLYDSLSINSADLVNRNPTLLSVMFYGNASWVIFRAACHGSNDNRLQIFVHFIWRKNNARSRFFHFTSNSRVEIY